MKEIPKITIDELIKRYSVLLLDAYGVLVHSSGALEGAGELIAELNQKGTSYFILTNDASKLPLTTSKLFQKYGLEINPNRIITSGSLLKSYFGTHGLRGARCIVLGPSDSVQYVKDAGGEIVPPENEFDVVVIGDEDGFSFLETVDAVLSGLFHKLDRGEKFHLVLPNPDLIYPKADNGYGITSGSIALMLEAALQLRFPGRSDMYFERLGKPHAVIYNEAIRRSGTRDMVMIGDQLETDIRGANDIGLDSALVMTGVTGAMANKLSKRLRPNYLLTSLK